MRIVTRCAQFSKTFLKKSFLSSPQCISLSLTSPTLSLFFPFPIVFYLLCNSVLDDQIYSFWINNTKYDFILVFKRLYFFFVIFLRVVAVGDMALRRLINQVNWMCFFLLFYFLLFFIRTNCGFWWVLAICYSSECGNCTDAKTLILGLRCSDFWCIV